LPAAERRERLESFFRRMLTEAAGSGLTEDEIINYLKERDNHEPH